MRSHLLLSVCIGWVAAQVPSKQTWLMNASTIIMPCNDTGFTDPASVANWGIVDWDWSNAKEVWDKNTPMDDEEMLFQQVQMTAAANPNQASWVYRGSVYAYPWYTSVRTILEDPAYSDWFIKFKPSPPWFSPKCDDNFKPARCSDYYHMQEQTPGYPSGDGNCSAPGCDCGPLPCGFYMWNHSTTAVVDGQTFLDWFIHDYVFNAVGSSPLVSGFFFDDIWPGASGNFPDAKSGHIVNDTGMTADDLVTITAAYWSNMQALQNYTLSQGKFAWQMFWTGQPDGQPAHTCPTALVLNATCATDLRALCTASSPAQSRTMMYSFGHSCSGDPNKLVDWEQDLANFLLVRGPYAYLGHGWMRCSKTYAFPDLLNADYGEPLGLCAETAPDSGVFVREFTKASIQMDCGSWTPTITFK